MSDYIRGHHYVGIRTYGYSPRETSRFSSDGCCVFFTDEEGTFESRSDRKSTPEEAAAYVARENARIDAWREHNLSVLAARRRA